jgi:UDP-glucuronate decarboxylase
MERTEKSAKRTRVLVTGGAGFVGSHLCERLLLKGAHVVCLDNFSTGCAENIAHLLAGDAFEVLMQDVAVPVDLEVDQVFNLACCASPKWYQDNPIQTMKSSVYGAINVLELGRRTHAVVLQASTSEVYGDPSVHPQSECYWGNVNPIGPRACYDEGKRCAETLFFDYHRQYDVRIKVARVFNTYGPRMQPHDGRVVSNFVCCALRGLPLTIYGSGEQTRSFCYVEDLTDGLVRLMWSRDECTGPVNLGNPQETSVLQLAREIIDLTGSRSCIRRIRGAADDPQRRRPDIRAADAQLGWKPHVELRAGLRKTIEYFDGVFSRGAETRGGDLGGRVTLGKNGNLAGYPL